MVHHMKTRSHTRAAKLKRDFVQKMRLRGDTGFSCPSYRELDQQTYLRAMQELVQHVEKANKGSSHEQLTATDILDEESKQSMNSTSGRRRSKRIHESRVNHPDEGELHATIPRPIAPRTRKGGRHSKSDPTHCATSMLSPPVSLVSDIVFHLDFERAVISRDSLGNVKQQFPVSKSSDGPPPNVRRSVSLAKMNEIITLEGEFMKFLGF
ncbi:hypothetical protein BR93DRAFT_924643 [Coniochaeta sp. PMI_546]|nr:hypothetical protein BR93DRAFT_924643 [Coniochaeta sp. PMI_546]